MRPSAIVLVLLGLGVAVAATAFLWQPGLDSLYDDSVSYLVLAQWLSPWHAASAAVAAAAPLEKYPPVFPLLLALTGGAYDWRIAHLVVALCFALSVVLLALHASRISRSRALGIACAVAFALMPGAWLIAKGILSEYPYMVLSLGVLLWHGRGEDAPPTRRDAAILCALLAATMLTRTIGVSLAIALAAAETFAFRRRHDAVRAKRMAAAIGAAIALALAWYLVRPAGGPDQYAQSLEVMREGAGMDMVGWLAGSIAANAGAIAAGWLHALMIFWGEPSNPRFIIVAAIGLAGLGASVYRASDGHLDGLYVAVYLGMLLLWPYPGQMYRLAFPVFPLVLVHAFWALRAGLAQRLPAATSERWAAGAVALPLAACMPAVLFYVGARAQMPDEPSRPMPKTSIAEFYRIPSGPAAQENAWRQIDVMQDLRHLADTTPPDARIMWYTPDYVALLGHRRGVPLRRPGNPADLAQQLRATGADYIYLSEVQPRDSLWHDGSPLFPAYLARGMARIEWARGGPRGDIRAMLLKVDKNKITHPERTP
ncbi:MAG TPA: hypothetical protein VFE23_13465 [Usitatibacter sp.]|jgi:hypothetical protein|nr:hypothetical protein [Usitatibacter sp.]